MLAIIDPLAAARAGAGLIAPAAPVSSTGASTHHRGRATPRSAAHRRLPQTVAAPRLATHTTGATHRLATHTTHGRRTAVAARPARGIRPALVPTMCEAVVDAVAWPRGWRVECAGPRTGLLGLTNPGGSTTLYVRSDESLATMHVVALHEAGHAWDLARLDTAGIERWCAKRGCDAARFFSGGSGGAGWGQPGGAEDWAAAWDACHGGEYHRSYLGLAPPTPADCALQNVLVGYVAPASAR